LFKVFSMSFSDDFPLYFRLSIETVFRNIEK